MVAIGSLGIRILGDQPVPDRTFSITSAVRIVIAILTALAIYGAYVRYVIAKGHG